MAASEFFRDPLFGVATTLLAYVGASALHRRWRWLHPLLVTCGVLIAFLLIAGIPYPQYRAGGDFIAFFLGPATIALGVPLYKQAQKVRKHLLPLLATVAIGAACGLASAALFVKLAGGSDQLLRSMLPKSVTTPISIELSRQLGGVPELTAVFTALAGLMGSVMGPWLLRTCGVRGDLAIGLAIGTSSHGIGTARLVRESELQGGTSGLAMALAGIITAILTVPLRWWPGSAS